MSTFSGLNTAYTGLSAARKGLDVVGQNVANANVAGYTRQRLNTSAAPALAPTGPLAAGTGVGQGVSVDSIARLGSQQLDTRVRSTAGAAGYSAVRANALLELEDGFREPGSEGLSASLQSLSAAWQGMSNKPGDNAAAAVLLSAATGVAAQIAAGYNGVAEQWTSTRSALNEMVTEVNAGAARLANLNSAIRSTLASGASANELVDQRNTLATTLSALTGATVRESSGGMVDVLIDGNALVSGTSARSLTVTGGSSMTDPAETVVGWADRPGSAGISKGEIAGAASLLAPAGKGGTLAKAAESYNDVAAALAGSVNALHRQGATTAGTANLDFFAVGSPAATTLKAIPADASGIAAGYPGADGKGSLDGRLADAISQLGSKPGSADAVWSAFVTATASQSRTELQQAALADVAASSAVDLQLSNASVDLDEENVNLLMYQQAYQGAARVMTAIDEMLDTLINRTGIVGR
ncbi:flagellar hook-associated protein FlgK [Arthrobacter yangruifuii]|uniref:Flagellar hook-associated protein 1 n=1 Tax=Arthrobacter yangruifuii TaxID=2606616 RepID=A0A5N6MEU7_9MICC|nr:flagellar hook-associated protein FlgK [Arthrobacter yangruifuii]KAD3456105.1 flagellar hook-associated protein FlgK [Arthrobacter yangruifuii]